MKAGRRNELPQADRVGRRIGERVVCTFYDGQESQFQRHVTRFELFDDVVQIQLAAFADDFERFGAAGEQQTLLFDTRVGVQVFLKLETVSDAVPDVGVGRGLDDVGIRQPDRLSLEAVGVGADGVVIDR